MSRQGLPENERILELLASRATEGLSGDEARELDARLRDQPDSDDAAFELAAAAIDLSLSRHEIAPMPRGLRARLEADAPRWVGAASLTPGHGDGAAGRAPGGVRARPPSGSRFIQGAGWLVGAACLIAAVAGWWPRLVATARAEGLTVERQRREMLARGACVTAHWSDWDDPEISGVRGDVVWCGGSQRGFVRFEGLPRNDPAQQQYQLWIVDDRGAGDAPGRTAPISGAVFDGGPGEVLVPFGAPIRVGDVQYFAVTIERPGGAWISDMKRRVVKAAVKGRATAG